MSLRPARRVAAALVLLLLALPAAAQLGAPPEVLSLRLAADTEKIVAGGSFRVAVVATIAPGWHVNSNAPLEDYLIPTEAAIGPVEGLTFGPPSYPAHREAKLPFSDKPLALYDGQTVIVFEGKADAALAPGPRTLRATLDYQPCNDAQCLAPSQTEAMLEIEVVPAGTTVAPANAALFPLAGDRSPASEGATDAAPAATPESGPFSGRSLPAILGLVFLAGLALNLTPCVYPLIPITVGFFSRQSEGKTSRTFGLALAYVLGMSVTYSALGVFAALSGSLFGSWLQKPAVLVVIAAVVLALALSMFGLYELQAPHFITDRTGSKGGVLGALTMGLFVGFVAAPCIGPFVLSLLTYVAQQGSAPLGFALFFTLTMGLGLPYLVLGTVSGSLKAMPRSGEWMIAVRKVFGFVLVALAAWFLRPLLPERVFAWAVALPLLAGGVWFLFFEKAGAGVRWFRGLKVALGLALLAVGAWFVVPSKHADGLAFRPYSDAALAEASAAGKPVVIDFFADWCLPCKELEKFTFTDPAVAKALDGWVLLKADLTKSASPEVAALRTRWNVQGVPTIVFLGPDGKESLPRVVQFEKPAAFLARFPK
ncbi:MAG: cytochrome c biogenesis protein CcdA [Thermoanaerobaculia bacterium]|jgi:thiol:disulfide interchange protein DsbD|nr:cytochrome c biogenesis protein CcdA [Thermoanaerobaculia bacterium]